MVTDSASTLYGTNPSYDAAGGVTQDGANTYRYDAEGRVCAVESTPWAGYTNRTGYIYNAEGVRVAKGTLSLSGALSCDLSSNGFQLTESYVLGPGGEELTMVDYDAGGNRSWRLTNVYAAGKLVGTYDASGLHLHVSDPLGSRRMQISGNVATAGQPETEFQSMPYGNLLGPSTDPGAPYDPDNPYIADDASPLHFTGKERDTESGNDYFGARYYASSMGRFLSPDPLPWLGWQHGNSKDRERFAAFISNPQSLNLYAYVNGNPLSRTDPTGMYICNGGAQQCQALQNSLDAVKRAADALSKGNAAEQSLGKKLNGVLDFYGKAGVDNGVKVGFADLGGKAWGQTSTSFFTGKTSITFDNHAFNQGYAFGAETAAHEGAHGVDKITSFGMMFWGKVQGTEAHAYQAEAAVDRGLGTATASDGNSPVWNPGWGAAAESNSANAINANATSTAHGECGGGCFGEPQN